jgi:hypothetical protein
MGFELRALHLQRRCSTAWRTPPALLWLFWRWGFNLQGLVLNQDPPGLCIPSGWDCVWVARA